MLGKKFILSVKETLQLLTGFCYEALEFLKVPHDRYPKILDGVRMNKLGKAELVYIDYDNQRIVVAISVLQMMIQSSPYSTNDSPTIYRHLGYKLACIWHKFVTEGEKQDFVEGDVKSSIFAESLALIKGVPVINLPMNDDMAQKFKTVMGYNSDDMQPVLKMLKEDYKMDCKIRKVYDPSDGQQKGFATFTKEEHIRRYKELTTLYDDSMQRNVSSVVEGERGSKTNPFEDVDEAADYILKIERDYLTADTYRQKIDNEQYFYDFENDMFRISWASPNVGYYALSDALYPCFVVNQLAPQVVGNEIIFPRFTIKPSLRNNKFLFRGQSEFHAPCKPSIFRKVRDSYVDDVIQMNELKVLLRQHPLVKLFEQGFMLMNEFIKFKINYSGLGQHYYNKTNLLDLTSEMEVAKFFAVTYFDMENDRYVPYSGDKLGVLYYYEIKPDSFNRKKSPIDTIGKQPFMRSGNQYGFLIPLEENDDFNVFPDVHYVFFKHNSTITNRIFEESLKGDKYMPQEMLRSNWYRRMSDDATKQRVSIEALKLNYLENPQMSHTKILKDLRSKGFSIDPKYTSHFTEDELASYYNHSLEIWEEFCSNIYFHGPEGRLLKKHLHNLPNDSRYRWAFYR